MTKVCHHRRGRLLSLPSRVVLVFVGSLLLSVNAAYSQDTITIFRQKAPLIEILKQIRKQTGFSYLVTTELLRTAPAISINMRNASIKDLLNEIFKGRELEYTIIGRTIVVRKKSL